MPLFMRKALLGIKLEGAYAADPTIAGADAFLVKNLRITPMNAEFAARDVIRSYFGNSEQLPVGVHAMTEFEVEMAGSGTAATAPKWGRVMRASAMSETVTAADVTGTAQAGAARAITLAVGASAVDDFYNGMPIDLTGGTGAGQTNLITDYNGTTKVATVSKSWVTPPNATSIYAIRANVQYRPISASLESAALLCNYDGVQHKMLGLRGSVVARLNAKGIPVFAFRGLGLYQNVADVGAFTPDYSAFRTPLVANSGNTPIFHLHDTLPVVESFELDVANAPFFRQLIGSESIQITDREPTGKVVFEATTVAFKDWWSVAKAGTLDSAAFTHGNVTGNRVSCVAPLVQIKPPTYSDSQGVLMNNSDLVICPGVGIGNDDFYVTSW